MLSSEVVVFLIIAVSVIASAVAMLLSQNAVHSVLFLVVNFAAVAALYLTLGAAVHCPGAGNRVCRRNHDPVPVCGHAVGGGTPAW